MRIILTVKQINSNTSENLSDGSVSQWQDEIVKQISCSLSRETPKCSGDSPAISKARDAIKKLQANMTPSTARKCPVSHRPGNVEQTTSTTPIPRKCPVAHKSPPAYEEREKDFTTQGKPSSLECPFAKMTKSGTVDPSSQFDPIAAEFHADSLSAQSLEEARACGRCPMRFMDKHSPEEIAEYFEKHKHELPRSHEICVRRYQQNESSIRRLDEKYGNIVSMIQGLGNKHKQYLQTEEQENQSGMDQKSTAAVEKWAEAVEATDNRDPVDGEPDCRVSHFDKPLRDVRVGESPTRPWGISVPVNRPKALSAVSSQEPLPASPVKSRLASSHSKPAVNQATPTTVQSQQTQSLASTSRTRGNRRSQIIFNGPVFLGYSPEQAAVFLQQLGMNARTG